MKIKMKLLPLTAAIAVALSSMTVLAEDVNADLKEQVATQQPIVLTPETVVPEGVVFSGYARYGLHYSDDVNKYVNAQGQLAGNATGRLGNEGNGGEFQFAKAFQSDTGAIWDVVLMLEHWGDEVGLKKMYAGVTNVFESQPNAYVWAGRDFHQRPQSGLNDYFWMSHDGQGAGVNNLEFGSAVKLNFAAVAQANSGTGDSGTYALTSKLHGIDVGIGELSILANYGFGSDNNADVDADGNDVLVDDPLTAYQVAAVMDMPWSMGSNQLIVRYADNADNSVYNKVEDQTTLFAQLEGNTVFSEIFKVGYLAAYHNLTVDGTPADDRTNYSAIVRPEYNWNSIHSTWLEAGYSLVDYDNDGENSAWKVTLSQNISIDTFGNGRPMLRFYATVGEADNQVNSTVAAKQDTLALGAMFEAWW